MILWFLQLFSSIAYKARDRDDLIAGLDEFLNEVIVLPPGEWDPKIRIAPPKKLPSAETRYRHIRSNGHCNQLTVFFVLRKCYRKIVNKVCSYLQEVHFFIKWVWTHKWIYWHEWCSWWWFGSSIGGRVGLHWEVKPWQI